MVNHDKYEANLYKRILPRLAKFELEDVAENARLHWTTLKYWENDRTKQPRLRSMIAVADTLQIRVAQRLRTRLASYA